MSELYDEDKDKIVIYTHYDQGDAIKGTIADSSKDILAEEIMGVLEKHFNLSRFKSSKAEVYILHGRKP